MPHTRLHERHAAYKAHLQGEEHGGEGLEADEPVEGEGGGGVVVGTVVERRDLIMLPASKGEINFN
jgi:hypothetical protein